MDFSGLFSLEGRVAVVTGGSRGIGEMIAEGFLAAGAAQVYITARKAAVVEETARELGERCIALPGDISTWPGSRRWPPIWRSWSRIDILVNNAGAAWGRISRSSRSGLGQGDEPQRQDAVFLTQKLYGLLKAGAATGHLAKVINIASIDGLRLNPRETYSIRRQSGRDPAHPPHGGTPDQGRYRRQLYLPGAFPSEMNKAAKLAPEKSAEGIPSGRVGTIEDMAGGAIFPASRAQGLCRGHAVADRRRDRQRGDPDRLCRSFRALSFGAGGSMSANLLSVAPDLIRGDAFLAWAGVRQPGPLASFPRGILLLRSTGEVFHN
jgi:NAD(P)-dependent dehydrogenase (short-subunit alcohol dehydrogenase family)